MWARNSKQICRIVIPCCFCCYCVTKCKTIVKLSHEAFQRFNLTCYRVLSKLSSNIRSISNLFLLSNRHWAMPTFRPSYTSGHWLAHYVELERSCHNFKFIRSSWNLHPSLSDFWLLTSDFWLPPSASRAHLTRPARKRAWFDAQISCSTLFRQLRCYLKVCDIT